MSEFSVGDIVEVIDNGKLYSTYDDFFFINDITMPNDWFYNYTIEDYSEGVVIHVGTHQDNIEGLLYLVRCDNRSVIINGKGLKLVRKNENTDQVIDFNKPLQVLSDTGNWVDIQFIQKDSIQVCYSVDGMLHLEKYEDITLRNKPLQGNLKDVILYEWNNQKRDNGDAEALINTVQILINKGILEDKTFEFPSGKINLEEITLNKTEEK